MKVRFVGATEAQVQWGSNDNPNEVLKVGRIYLVDAIKVHSWHTKVRIFGFDGVFNSVSFKPVKSYGARRQSVHTASVPPSDEPQPDDSVRPVSGSGSKEEDPS